MKRFILKPWMLAVTAAAIPALAWAGQAAATASGWCCPFCP